MLDFDMDHEEFAKIKVAGIGGGGNNAPKKASMKSEKPYKARIWSLLRQAWAAVLVPVRRRLSPMLPETSVH